MTTRHNAMLARHGAMLARVLPQRGAVTARAADDRRSLPAQELPAVPSYTGRLYFERVQDYAGYGRARPLDTDGGRSRLIIPADWDVPVNREILLSVEGVDGGDVAAYRVLAAMRHAELGGVTVLTLTPVY